MEVTQRSPSITSVVCVCSTADGDPFPISKQTKVLLGTFLSVGLLLVLQYSAPSHPSPTVLLDFSQLSVFLLPFLVAYLFSWLQPSLNYTVIS